MGKNVAVAHTPPVDAEKVYGQTIRPLHPGRAKGCKLCKKLTVAKRRARRQRDREKAKKNKELHENDDRTEA